ncbi:DUF3109 family protein [Fulvivirga sp. M361]|uniref:DUF3109 family protein n=1 Tax=Fulvivirga sp. M361 TaxID=2594266 RepID=UPI00117AF575|nr:DUF3109 family protein [Fulvivirga sp. M361]TRX61891.1 DUF3109 family protein [Fulvivirga sp. M361]
MIEFGKTIISDDIKDNFFVCNLEKCKGACCVEGDLGAPLEEDELDVLKQAYEKIKPFLSEEGIRAIEQQGPYILDEEGEYSTPTIGGKECAYAIYDKEGILKCGIEQAYNEKQTDFKKPISCHLYPIRITKYDEFDALNYDQWDICDAACHLGASLNVPVYNFLKEPLIRKYGKSWYNDLVDLLEKESS